MPVRAAWRAVRRSTPYVFTTYSLFVLGTVIFINDNVVDSTFIQGESMAPTLSPDCKATGVEDLILWKKWEPIANLQRGDVVHFANPAKPEGLAVKRVIALEGDTVLLDRRRRPSNKEGPEPPEAKAWDAWKGEAKVPPGHVWVEGDNWRSTIDSNDYGPISKNLIIGRAVRILWPPQRFLYTPWDGFKSRTKVVERTILEDWTEVGVPVELAEINESRIIPP